MRAITRSHLAPMFIAAAILTAGLPAHLVTSVAPHRTATEAALFCPAGTNWDDILRTCA